MADETVATPAPPTGDGAASNPLRAGLPADRITNPCSVVFFGASGDLFKRMLLPAIYSMRLSGTLPTDFALVGFARSRRIPTTPSASTAASSSSSSCRPIEKPQGALWDDFCAPHQLCHAPISTTRAILSPSKSGSRRTTETSERPATTSSISRRRRRSFPRSSSISRSPVSRRAETAGRASSSRNPSAPTSSRRARCSARSRAVFPENEIYRIDHYLGKEPVQDIIALRFANTIFEPIWNRNYVQNVQITSAESLGVEERGGYYDHAGALRDMIQNHVINLLALVAMEAPISSDADDIRNEKYKVLSAIEPPAHADVWSMSARGQYGPGTIDGRPVKGYRQEAGRRAGFEHRNVRGGQALDRELALGRRAVLPALRESACRARFRRSPLRSSRSRTASTANRPTTSSRTCS